MFLMVTWLGVHRACNIEMFYKTSFLQLYSVQRAFPVNVYRLDRSPDLTPNDFFLWVTLNLRFTLIGAKHKAAIQEEVQYSSNSTRHDTLVYL